MKKLNLTILLTVLLSMAGAKAFAHDIEVKNADGVTIYYSWTNDNTTLAVSYQGSSYDEYSDEYTGNVVIPESVTYNEATYSVTSIGDGAFAYCSSLTSITIPSSVTSIGEDVFWYCSSLTSVTSHIESPFEIDSQVFHGSLDNSPTLYVPKGKVEAYRNTAGWNVFTNIEEIGLCATPTIAFEDGKLIFNCETEGASCHYTISGDNNKSGTQSEVSLNTTITVSVYATKPGCIDSDVATMDIEMSMGSKGDVNGDGIIDVSDYIGVANLILFGTIDGK